MGSCAIIPMASLFVEYTEQKTLQLFQSFPTKVLHNDSEWLISPSLQLFQSFPTEVAQNDLEWPISPDS